MTLDQTEPIDEKVSEVRRWAEDLTGEQKDWDSDPSYLVPATIGNLVSRIENTRNSLDFVFAYQGVGKSVAARYLKWLSEDEGSKLGNVLYVKLKEPGNIVHQMFLAFRDQDNSFEEIANKALFAVLYEYAKSRPSFWHRLDELMGKRDITSEEWNTINSVLSGKKYGPEDRLGPPEFDSILALIPEKRRIELEEKVLFRLIGRYYTNFYLSAIVVDNPDYRKNDVRLALNDLDALSRFWQHLVLSEAWAGNFVVFMQRELNVQHFFIGKGNRLEIERFRPEELVRHYRDRFSDNLPFSEEALLQLATFANGNFRRFKRYILLSIEKWEGTESRNRAPTIEILSVNETVTERELAHDLEIELGPLFSGDAARNACRVMSFVMRDNRKANQKTIADALALSEDVVGRILKSLEAEKYVKRTRTSEGYVIGLA